MNTNKPTHYVKFTGDFKDLKPNGWKFGKFYGHNYRAYTRSFRKDSYCDWEFMIWQAGRFLELTDFFQHSYLIVKELLEGRQEEYNKTFYGKDTYSFVVDMEDYTINKLKWNINGDGFLYKEHDRLKSQGLCGKEFKEQYGVICNAHYKKYRKVNYTDEQINGMIEFLNKGWVEIIGHEKRILD